MEVCSTRTLTNANFEKLPLQMQHQSPTNKSISKTMNHKIRKRIMKPTTVLPFLVAAVCITRGEASFVTPSPMIRFGITRPTTTRWGSATVDIPKPVAPPKKKEKVTPEAQELTQVLLEREENKSPFKYVVAQTAPSVRIAFSEVFGKEPGAFKADLLVASLKELGFDLVLDTNLAADLTICEEGQELLERILAREEAKETGKVPAKPLPLFTSCCPGWMKLVQKSAPELSPYISTCKSPHMSESNIILVVAALFRSLT